MPKILGIDIPGNKRLEYSLCYIYGIGLSRAQEIVKKAEKNCLISTGNKLYESRRNFIKEWAWEFFPEVKCFTEKRMLNRQRNNIFSI